MACSTKHATGDCPHDHRSGGALNVAADPVLGGMELARLLGARTLLVRRPLIRGAAALSRRLRVQPTPPGWVDLAFSVPVMDCTRARRELGWTPARSAGEALLEVIDGMRAGAGADTPPLAPDTAGSPRLGEVASGVGARDPGSS